MECSDFPFTFRGKSYLADRTFSGEVAAFILEADTCRHINDAPGTPRMRLRSLLEGMRAGLVVFVAEDPSLGAHMVGSTAKPIPEDWRGMRRAEAYLTSPWIRTCEVVAGRGPDAEAVIDGEEATRASNLLVVAKPGNMVMFARKAPDASAQ